MDRTKQHPQPPVRVLRKWHPAILVAAVLALSAGTYRYAMAGPQPLDHWAFQAPQATTPPEDPTGWSRNPVDTFVRAQLAKRDVAPSPEAERRTLTRRLFLDLTGLPPAPQIVDQFVKNTSPEAYERLVESILTSPHYGERWGRHWLDLARYADSAGFEADFARPAWLYRDWVINAINRNQPFDQFVIEQLAGDLLPSASLEQRIATGFHGVGPHTQGLPHLMVMNRVTTTGTVFLGLTLECAQCHDHKTDPLSQREYYELYSFFDQAKLLKLEVKVLDESKKTKDLRTELQALRTRFEKRENTLRDSLDKWIAEVDDATRKKIGRKVVLSLDKPANKRSEPDIFRIFQARCKLDEMHTKLKKELTEREEEFSVVHTALVMQRHPKVTRFFHQGNYESLGDVVQPGIPAFLHNLPDQAAKSTDRLQLAHWLVSPENPLTARVTVNRIWQRYFGLGLVETESDFGVQTPPPTHPKLLDWLAVEFIQSGWNLKHIHRLIVNSATYRQHSRSRPELEVDDPRNRWLARQSRLRLEAEVIRDGFLEASGLITQRIGGPSVYPHQPGGSVDFQGLTKKWTVSEGPDKYRRGMYTWLWRKDPHPLLVLFDSPDSDIPCSRRERSTTPVQALSLLNDTALVECARSLGTRVLNGPHVDREERIDFLFSLCLGRPAEPGERQVLFELLTRERAQLEKNIEDAKLIAGETQNPIDQAMWTIAARVVLNLDEFITRE